MVQQIFFSAPGEVELRRVPQPPPPGNGEVLVRTAFLGICGTDLHVLHGKYRIKPPLVIGHEMAGVVEAVGTNVAHLAAGDRIALNPVRPCGHCIACRRQRFNICEAATVIGFALPGAAQTQFLVDSRQLHKVPDNVALRHAVLAEPLSVAIHAVSRAETLDEVLVIGGGTIGLCVLAAAKASGAGRVTVVEPVAAKRALALRLGAAEALAPDDPLPARSFSTCFDIVASPSTLAVAEAGCLSGGTIVVVGTAFGRAQIDLPRLQRYEITLRGSSIFPDADMIAALALIGSGTLDAEALITAVIPLARAAEAYAGAAEPANVKTLIAMSAG